MSFNSVLGKGKIEPSGTERRFLELALKVAPAPFSPHFSFLSLSLSLSLSSLSLGLLFHATAALKAADGRRGVKSQSRSTMIL